MHPEAQRTQPSPGPGPAGLRTFFLVWTGQLISLIGSSLTGFALGVWVFQETGSTTRFALISLATALPGILMSPLAGALVDRWDRRRAMMLSDAGAGLSTLTLALLLWSGRLELWHIYLLVALSAIFSAFQWPAYSAAITLLVPRQHLGRAAGMVQMAEAAGQIVAPVTAGALLGLVGLRGIMLIDVATFLVALSILAAVRFPRPPVSQEGKAARGSLLREAAFGWRYIRARPGFFSLLLFFAATNLTFNLVGVLFTPLVLGFASVAVLGGLLTTGGLGMLSGSLVMSAWGGPRTRVYGILGFTLLSGLVLLVGGLYTSIPILGTGIVIYMFGFPIVNGCSQAIWQAKVAPDVQGRVFAVRRMIAWSSTPVAYVLAGPLADRVFEPLMAEGGPLAATLGPIMGVGPGRGIGLLYVVLGVLAIGIAVAGYLYRPLRRLEADLPDHGAGPEPGAGVEPAGAGG